MIMRCLLCLLVLLATPAWAESTQAKPETLKFEKVIDGSTIMASGRAISLWGVKRISPSSPYAWAATLYLKTMLTKGALSCADAGKAGERQIMHCYVDRADVGSLLVQMGMAEADGPYYRYEEALAQTKQRGIWKTHGKSL